MGLLTFQRVEMEVMAPHISRVLRDFKRCKEHVQPSGMFRLNAFRRTVPVKFGQAFVPE